MADIPSNVVLAREFGKRFDTFSIGTNDLTQFVPGLDRELERLAHPFEERNRAVKQMARDLMERAHEVDTRLGIRGRALRDHAEFAAFPVDDNTDSISVNPASVIQVCKAQAEDGWRGCLEPTNATLSSRRQGRRRHCAQRLRGKCRPEAPWNRPPKLARLGRGPLRKCPRGT